MTKILDCTIRDGGHLNGWNFTDECVKDTFEAAQLCGADFFEIGYRSYSAGKFARCHDYDLREIIKDKGDVKLAVMVNARDFCNDLFYKNDYVDIVRIACHPNEISQGVENCKQLQDKGYETFLHLMDVSHISNEQLDSLDNYPKNSVLYFADSHGELLPDEIEESFKFLREKGFKRIGFHAHNNKQLAFINTLTAIICKAYSVDVTVYGMGRGAGNTPAELLFDEIGRETKPYIKLIKKYYFDFYKQTPWGYSLKNLEIK